MLAWIWEESGYLCAARLKAAVPIWLPWVRQRRPLSPTLERQLLTISARQMDRRLQPRKHRLKRRLYGTTRPGTLLKRSEADAPKIGSDPGSGASASARLPHPCP